MIDNTQLQSILEPTVVLAREVGAWIKNERVHFSKDKIEVKGVNDLVTYVDKTSEEKLVKQLQNIFPEAGFIVEENTVSENKNYNWIVDPLDGTTNFIHGIPCYAISIGLEFNGEIILGIVHEINRDECFWATKNGGSFLNGEKINVSQNKFLKDSLVATGFPIYNFERIKPYLKTLEQLMRNTHGLRRIGSAATDLCYVACGRMDAYFEYNLQPWDVAAGALIVREAGGTVCDFNGEEDWLFGKEVIATNNFVHEEIFEVIHSNFIKNQ
jgi:myo-inositol-1(or 4)-monophosphatase